MFTQFFSHQKAVFWREGYLLLPPSLLKGQHYRAGPRFASPSLHGGNSISPGLKFATCLLFLLVLYKGDVKMKSCELQQLFAGSSHQRKHFYREYFYRLLKAD